MSLRLRALMISCAALLLIWGMGATSASGQAAGGTNVFTLVAPPTYCANARPDGCFSSPGMAYVNYMNNSNATVLGIVVWVVHNSIGQTVGYGTATISLAAGANSTAYPVIFSLTPGSYRSSVFAFAPNGVPISKPTNLSFTLAL